MTEELETKNTPIKRKRRSQTEILAALKAQLRAELMAEMSATPEAAAANAAAAIAAVEPGIVAKVNAAPNVLQNRVWIVLQESPHIMRGQGQFFGINGAGFLLKPGKKAFVPQGIVDVLEAAVEDIPDVDPDTLQVVGYRQRLRFPYSIVAAPVA
jgi:hypothetical protein